MLPRLAGDIVRSMADGPVTLEHRTNEGIVQITGGGSSFSLNCLQAHDFPELPADEGAGLSVPAEPLTEAIDRVARAASRDETRPVLTGVLLRLGPDGMTMVATDSYRLAVRQHGARRAPARRARGDRPGPGAHRGVPPAPALAKAESVEVVLTESQALFRIGDIRLTSRMIEGQFPDYRQLVPDTFEHDVAFDRGELLGVLTRIGVLAQRNTPVRLAFDAGTVTISATSDQVGEGRESLPVGFSGERLEIGFNVEFLRAGVESVAGDEVRLGLISPLRPGLLRGSGDEYRYLLMPIRLNA